MNGIKNKKLSGFTIVELLIVIVVIGILAAIVIVAYNGVQDRARTAKIQADMNALTKAIQGARIATAGPLRYVTNSTATGAGCWGKASGTDLASLPKTDSCWSTYLSSLDAISTASGVNVRGLVDPWGRPYYIDENEDETVGGPCKNDAYGTYATPFTTGQTMNKLFLNSYC